MTLIEQIKNDQLTARKEHNAPVATLLTTLIGEAEMVGKNKRNGAPTDKEVHSVITKFMKGNTEILSLFHADEDCCVTAAFENDILMSYRPGQLSEDILRKTIEAIGNELNLHSPRDMGALMKGLKVRCEGQYDGKLASTLVKEYLNS